MFASILMQQPVGAAEDSVAVFNRRILPILRSEKPSSCTECHLSGVDLKQYIVDDPGETFAALRAAGLVDVERPEQSELLKLIERRPEKPSLINEAVRREEAAAFRAWLTEASKDSAMLAKQSAAKVGPVVPDEVIRHTRADRVLESFRDEVWTEIGRCTGCHTPGLNKKQVEEFGESVSWIVPDDPAATLAKLVESENINREKPMESRLLTKPAMIEDHAGGKKLVPGDRTWNQFTRFLNDYSATVSGRFNTAKSLPVADEEFTLALPMENGPWVKMTDIPPDYAEAFIRVDVFPAESETSPPSENMPISRIAIAERLAWKGVWQQTLTLAAPKNSALAEKHLSRRNLPAGSFRDRVFADRDGREPTAPPESWNDEVFIGESEVTSDWKRGFGRPTVIRWPAAGE